jgi:nucleoside 2-deoxyribosyltransferase
MNAQSHIDDVHDLDEGSWIYLSLREVDIRMGRDLRSRIVEVCESSGWPAVSWMPPAHKGNVTDSSRFFEGMSHAVEHADVVVVLMNRRSTMTDAELAFAYRHNRPVVGLRVVSEESDDSEVQAMLQRYARARLIDGEDLDACIAGLSEVLTDPEFALTIRKAAGEKFDHA